MADHAVTVNIPQSTGDIKGLIDTAVLDEVLGGAHRRMIQTG
jgi:hypothetical protein